MSEHGQAMTEWLLAMTLLAVVFWLPINGQPILQWLMNLGSQVQSYFSNLLNNLSFLPGVGL
ncbi:hypothetical protein CWI84_05420 [Idiomarina tyrosinivorans]|uniref:Uncharacterized protein n=1 Tax=Idiomarina tyrosinivorans TaxID=1445662 RepID=A0A432ZRG5_9GAMM|nr:hypothetical protein [Idiomarina tyrosinivorans]RUO80497.1 hypothetical protein CWI84_05420 [Idiomarina tyrosinivorans]